MRDNRDSVMAMLEAFAYDPLISWRLVAQGVSAPPSSPADSAEKTEVVEERPRGDTVDVEKITAEIIRGRAQTTEDDFPKLMKLKSQDSEEKQDDAQETLNSRYYYVIH